MARSWRGFGVVLAGMLLSGPLVTPAPMPADAHGGDTDVVHVCMTRRGLPRFVQPSQTCRVGETAMHWPLTPTVGPAGPAGPGGPQGPQGPPGPSGSDADTPIVVDATGVRVGPVVSFDANLLDSVVVAFRHSGMVIPLHVQRTRFLPFRYLQLWFEATDCSGPPLVEGGASTPWSDLPFQFAQDAVVGLPGSTIYVPDTHPGGSFTTVRSYERLGACTQGAGESRFLYPARPLIDLNTLFAPPFSVR